MPDAHTQLTDRNGQVYQVYIDDDAAGPHVELFLEPGGRDSPRIGHLTLYWEEPSVLQLAAVYLRPEFRDRGLGSCLIQWAIAYARTHAVFRIIGWLSKDEVAEAPQLLDWFERHGFVVRRITHPHNAAMITLTLRATPDAVDYRP